MRFICPICLKRMIFFYKKTKCGHKFHHKCLKEWKTRTNKCPNCSKELFNYYGTYHQQNNIHINLKHNNNSILIKDCSTNQVYRPIKYTDIPYIKGSNNTVIITEIIKTPNGQQKNNKYITTPYAMDIFRQLIHIFYECHNKINNIEKNIDVDNIIRETKTYAFTEDYEYMPVKTLRIN